MILSGMEPNISCDAVRYNTLGDHQEVLVCALIVDIAYTENRIIELFLQRLRSKKGVMKFIPYSFHWSKIEFVPIDQKYHRNLVPEKSPRSKSWIRRCDGLAWFGWSFNFRKIFLQTLSFIHTGGALWSHLEQWHSGAIWNTFWIRHSAWEYSVRGDFNCKK